MSSQVRFAKVLRRLRRLVPDGRRTATQDRSGPPLHVTRVETYAKYQRHADRSGPDYVRRAERERLLIPPGETPFSVSAYCYICAAERTMRVGYAYAPRSAGRAEPNWREWLQCETCGFNNRIRAAMHILEQECQPGVSAIYATEQTTSLYRHLRARYQHVTGSEFLGHSIPLGSIDPQGIRNENLTSLTFADDSFDVILSFEVLEHIPDYPLALSEMLRVLRPGGRVLISAPFLLDRFETLVRARVNPDGSVMHLLEPEYHGDPLSADGILCFQHFGWDLLDCMRNTGFVDAAALLYWSEELGYFGTEQVLFLARKAH